MQQRNNYPSVRQDFNSFFLVISHRVIVCQRHTNEDAFIGLVFTYYAQYTAFFIYKKHGNKISQDHLGRMVHCNRKGFKALHSNPASTSDLYKGITIIMCIIIVLYTPSSNFRQQCHCIIDAFKHSSNHPSVILFLFVLDFACVDYTDLVRLLNAPYFT